MAAEARSASTRAARNASASSSVMGRGRSTRASATTDAENEADRESTCWLVLR
jgi:hypothetical protein